MSEGSPKAIVIYDGSCGLCSGNLNWLRRLDTLHQFGSMPNQDPEEFRRFPQHGSRVPISYVKNFLMFWDSILGLLEVKLLGS